MGSKLPRLTVERVRRAVERDGWFWVRQSGSHAMYRHATKPGRVTLSIHPSEEVKPKTLARILNDAGLDVDEFIKLL